MSPRAIGTHPGAARLRQGLALLAGALVLAVAVGAQDDRFFLTPLLLGTTYLAAASLGGRRGGFWATAVVLVAWGAAVVAVREIGPDLDTAGVYLFAVGVGAGVGAALTARGFEVDPAGIAATVALAGLALALSTRADALTDARSYALAVGLVGLVNVALGARRR